ALVSERGTKTALILIIPVTNSKPKHWAFQAARQQHCHTALTPRNLVCAQPKILVAISRTAGMPPRALLMASAVSFAKASIKAPFLFRLMGVPSVQPKSMAQSMGIL